jgi:DNA-binding CsgD family transcriptional regulator
MFVTVGNSSGMALLNENYRGFVAGGVSRPAEPGETDPNALTAELTDKQRQVLDLLIQHKTSKEISRALGISPHTVDQRIMLSRAKLGVSTRSEVAQAYRRLIDAKAPVDPIQPAPPAAPPIWEQPVYGFSHVASPAFPFHQGNQDGLVAISLNLPSAEAMLPKAVRPSEGTAAGYHHVLPERFDGPYGTVLRLGAISLITVFLMLILMGGLAMFAQLSQIFDR